MYAYILSFPLPLFLPSFLSILPPSSLLPSPLPPSSLLPSLLPSLPHRLEVPVSTLTSTSPLNQHLTFAPHGPVLTPPPASTEVPAQMSLQWTHCIPVPAQRTTSAAAARTSTPAPRSHVKMAAAVPLTYSAQDSSSALVKLVQWVSPASSSSRRVPPPPARTEAPAAMATMPVESSTACVSRATVETRVQWT